MVETGEALHPVGIYLCVAPVETCTEQSAAQGPGQSLLRVQEQVPNSNSALQLELLSKAHYSMALLASLFDNMLCCSCATAAASSCKGGRNSDFLNHFGVSERQ
jgi:hypothetical protein